MVDDIQDQADAATPTMAAIDAALEPVRRLAAAPQPMNTAQLATVAASFRQALAILVYGPPPAHETVVEDPNEVAAASLVPGKSEPQFLPEDHPLGRVDRDSGGSGSESDGPATENDGTAADDTAEDLAG